MFKPLISAAAPATEETPAAAAAAAAEAPADGKISVLTQISYTF